MPHREYLVPFRLLEEKMRLIGCELLSSDELKALGMANSTATFDVSWDMAKAKGKVFKMIDSVKQFSFMNRWFIFKRNRQTTVVEAEAAAPSTNVPEPAVGRAANARNRASAVAKAASAIQKAPAAAAEAAAEAGEAGEAGEAAAARTVAVAPGPGADPAATKAFAVGQIFRFSTTASIVKDQLGIKDLGATRWLAPSAPFPIKDMEAGKEVQYPSMEHYIAGMRVKLGGKKPEVAASLFSREGTIHQRFLNDRLGLSNGGTKPLTEEQDYELLTTELAAVKKSTGNVVLKKTYGVSVDEAEWATQKDKVLEEALKQRWTGDARFHKIVETARNQGKYLLYDSTGATSNLGGSFNRNTGRIEGENRVGKIIMKLAGYPE